MHPESLTYTLHRQAVAVLRALDLPANTSAVARRFGESRPAWHDYVSGQHAPGTEKVTGWLATWNRRDDVPTLLVVLTGGTPTVLVVPR